MKRFAKSLLLISAFFFYCGVCFLIYLFLPSNSNRRRLVSHWNHQFAPVLQWILGIEVWMQSTGEQEERSGTLFLCNHLSFLDIIVLASLFPTVFVTSVEVRKSMPWGWIAQLSGCLFVERRSKSSLIGDLQEINQALEEGMNVVLFPEGTSSDGRSVLPFKKSLIQSAFISSNETPIQPLCINYRWCDGYPVTALHSSELFYFGEMGLWDQMNKIFDKDEIGVEVVWLSTLVGSASECRKKVGDLAYQAISQAYQPLF